MYHSLLYISYIQCIDDIYKASSKVLTLLVPLNPPHLHADVPDDSYVRMDPTFLWRDMLNLHKAFPLHCLVGGGDQLYNDGVWSICPSFKSWGEETM